MDDAFDIIDKHSASFKRRGADLAKQYAGGEVITVSEAARMLHLSNQTVRLLVKRGTLIGFAPGNRKILLFKAQVLDYLIHLQQEAIEYVAASTNRKAWYE
ncbi:helix-turn-helix domain-containing protein [Akkermansia sp.]|uniref:helix-turn-helix domain-containing protein n=1 Tax=Akkermansia sp. TaxID=1872421 RepID=UPI003AB44E93